MLNIFFFVYFLIISIDTILSDTDNQSTPLWLPKCCPKGKQISADGKACVMDNIASLEYDVNVGGTSHSADVLPVLVENKTVLYNLEHKTKFSCVRHELYVIQDDILVTPDNNVIIWDDFGENWTLSTTELCVDSVHIPQNFTLTVDRTFVALLCPSCKKRVCIHKCCREYYKLQISEDETNVDCIPSDQSSWSEVFLNSSKRPFVFHGFPQCSNGLYLNYLGRPVDVVNGHLQFPKMTIPRAEYCGDSSNRGTALLGCRQMSATIKHTFYGGLFCLGAVFLGLALGLHIWLPELRKTLHSRVLISHILCLLVGYVGLALVNLAPIPAPSAICSTTAFVIQFTMLAAIFWLNVMCVDIAWTFSGLRAPKASLTLGSDGHKFLYYSLYAWGSTAAISGVTAVLEYSPIVPSTSKFKPSFGAIACWFKHSESILLLVYGPMGVLLLSNIVLFVYTAYKIQRTQRDTANIVQHAGSKLKENKDRFTLYLKLFGLMGVTWVFEIVSWIVGGSDSYWYFTDVINALRSVFIFVLFCLKKKVYLLVKSKLSLKKTQNFPIHPRKSTTSSKLSSSMTSQRTNSIQLSQIS